MPMSLITGLPGHGKSIHAVRLMFDLMMANKKLPANKRKKVYACNFKDLDYQGLGAEQFEAHEWMHLDPGPNGAILFFDEVWEFFEARNAHQASSQSIKELAKHRQYGFDIYMITQGPFQIDSHVRALIDTHLHCVRPFGMKFYNIRTFQGLERFPDDKQARKRTADTSKKFKFDKKYFGYYKSAEVHTIKRKIPLKMFGAIVTLLFAIGAIWNLISWGAGFMGGMTDLELNPITGGLDNLGMPGFQTVNNGISEMQLSTGSVLTSESLLHSYYLQSMPLINGAPWTAPQYADIMEPKTYPKPHCVLIVESDTCLCISQQGTKMAVDHTICKDLAINGFFDPTLEPSKRSISRNTNTSTVNRSSQSSTYLPRRQTTTSKNKPFTNWNVQPYKHGSVGNR